MAGVQAYKTFVTLAGLLLILAAPAWAAERVALVIGNADYNEAAAKLRNPINDAIAVAAALRRLGFEVIEGLDLDEDGFYDKITAFDEAERGTEMALFFYAGHGLQVEGHNYLAPVDLRLETKQDLRRGAIELADVMEVMRSKTNLVILDACRNNPLAGDLARSLGLSRAVTANRGLARVESTGEMLIAYATAPGDVAADGTGDHSPYTSSLLEHLETPGMSVQELFTKVTGSVKKRTGNKQKPWTNSSLSQVVRLAPVPQTEPTEAGEQGTTNSPLTEQLTAELAVQRLAAEEELLFWESVKDSEDAADLQAYLDNYPEGTYEALAHNWLKRLSDSGTPSQSTVPTQEAPLVNSASAPSLEAVEAGLELSRADRRLIQLGLAAEGFDPGPADGLIGRGTRGAIGRWQASRGEASTGYLEVESAKLLLASGREQEAHQREAARLDAEEAERQRRDREAQVKALDDAAYAEAKSLGTAKSYDEYLRAYPSGRHAEEARRLRAETQKRREDPLRHAKETISKALTAAQWIERDSFHAFVLSHIASVQAEAGNTREALATVQQIEDAHDRTRAFVNVAEAQAKAGNVREAERSLSKAMATMQQIEEDYLRDLVLSSIASVQAEAGNTREALATVQRMEDAGDRAWAFSRIAKTQAEAGNVREAKRLLSKAMATMQQIEEDYLRVFVLSNIASVQAEAGNVREAERSLSKAMSTAQRIEDADVRAEAFIGIAEAQAEAGSVREAERSLSKAMATTQRIEDAGDRAWAFTGIARVQAKVGNVREALSTAQRIEDADVRAEAFIGIAEAQAEAGSVREAERSLSKAMSTAQRIEDAGDRALSFTGIARVQAKVGNVREAERSLSEALATAQRIEDAYSRAFALVAVASAQTKMALTP